MWALWIYMYVPGWNVSTDYLTCVYIHIYKGHPVQSRFLANISATIEAKIGKLLYWDMGLNLSGDLDARMCVSLQYQEI